MNRFHFSFILVFLILISAVHFSFAQAVNTDTANKFKTLAAGEQYKSSGWHEWLWGSNYRNIWATPITVKVLLLDTANGGLKPVETGGGNETKTLHLVNSQEKEYSIRSVNKTLGKVLPAALQKTFIEHKVNDEVSMSNPYAAATIPYMADKAGVYHSNLSYVYVPKQKALDKYNDVYGNDFYTLEQRIHGNWKEADNLGNFENYIETLKMIDTLNSCNSCVIDQKTFIRARLFDMFINDWDRHEGQWSWGEIKTGDKVTFIPVPKDRDQVYSTHNGLLLNLGLKAGGLNYMQPFDNNIKNVKNFNYEERNLDRRLINEATLSDWQSIALDLQQSLTDEVIEKSIQNLPAEIYPLIGKNTIEKLKARRSHLVEWATEYYNFISKEVEIPGSYLNEEFDVTRINNGETSVKVFGLNSQGIKKDTAFYTRIFKPSETKEIRLFGITGNDKYVIEGNNSNAIKLKIIGGINKDSVINNSPNNNKIVVYGNTVDSIQTGAQTQLKINKASMFHWYSYKWFTSDKKGFVPSVFYSNEDKLYVGLGYRIKHFAWGKEPYASNQLINYHYSLMDKSYSITYRALFPNLVAHSDFIILANYDNIRWVHFFGVGNETHFDPAYNAQYYTMRTRQWIVQPGFIKTFGKSTLNVYGFANGLEIINDSSKFLNKTYQPAKSYYDWKTFAGAGISYSFQYLNDAIVPTKGVYFNATASGAHNIKTGSSYYFNYAGTVHFYVPLISKFSLNIRTGAQTVTGNPEFYQLASIGGTLLRGFKRDRFWGKTAVYNTNDLRFISPVHSYLFNGKAGLQVFFDDGRVWIPGEKSDLWHTAYGAGFILAPFDFLYADFNYGRSQNESSIQVRITYFSKR